MEGQLAGRRRDTLNISLEDQDSATEIREYVLVTLNGRKEEGSVVLWGNGKEKTPNRK